MTDHKKQKRTGATTTAEMLKNFNPVTAIQAFQDETKRKFVRPPFARFKFAWKTPDGRNDSRYSFDFNYRSKGNNENELQGLIDLRAWGIKNKIDTCECFTATIYATTEKTKDTTQKIYNYPLFHWILRRGKWEYQEAAVIKFHPETGKFDTYYHFYNPHTLKFGKP